MHHHRQRGQVPFHHRAAARRPHARQPGEFACYSLRDRAQFHTERRVRHLVEQLHRRGATARQIHHQQHDADRGPWLAAIAAWDAVEAMWGATLDRTRLLPRPVLHEQVDGEWSFVETQRHLLFATDAWIGNAVLEQEAPYHPLGLPSSGMPADFASALGLTLDATPSLDELLAARSERMTAVRRLVDGLTETELDRVCRRKPADPYPDGEYVVRRCLGVVLKEEAEHHRYAVRDLDTLTLS